MRKALGAQSRLRRHLPFALFLLALAGLVIAYARPVAVVTIPAGQATIILKMDVSSSMLQTDIRPSRLAAAESAARSFVSRQLSTNRIGIVAFASIAQLVQSPTTGLENLNGAINGLTTGRGTAIGDGILTALDTIAEVNQNIAASTHNASSSNQATPVPEGSYIPDIVVLLTDGVYNTGTDPMEAAQQAVDHGVRVYTIGYGTSGGAVERGNNFFGGGGNNRGIDEESLWKIAALTGGKYYTATSANELQKVFESLPTYLVTRQETREISVAFATLGAILVLTAVMLSLFWHPLP